MDMMLQGKSYEMRLVGMALARHLPVFVFYRNHRNRVYKKELDVLQEFDLSSSRTKWQLCQILYVPAVLLHCRTFAVCRAMWAGIAAMSAILPFMEDMQYRVEEKNCRKHCRSSLFYHVVFSASSIYAYIEFLCGIGVGFSAKYGWQAVFNTFGALAIAAESYGLKGAVSLRVIQNVFGVVFALVFCAVFYLFMSKKEKRGAGEK